MDMFNSMPEVHFRSCGWGVCGGREGWGRGEGVGGAGVGVKGITSRLSIEIKK